MSLKLKVLLVLVRLVKESFSKGTDKVQTGGRELSVDEYLKQLDKAEEKTQN